MAYRAHVVVRSLNSRAPEDWERLRERLERDAERLGPIMGYWPDRESDRAEVTISTEAQESGWAILELVIAVTGALERAGIEDASLERFDFQNVPHEEAVPA